MKNELDYDDTAIAIKICLAHIEVAKQGLKINDLVDREAYLEAIKREEEKLEEYKKTNPEYFI